MTRYLIRRSTGDVFIYTDELAKRGDLEEVFADNPEQALKKPGMPDPNAISLDHIEAMTKSDLMIFAAVKLGLTVDGSKSKAELQDEVKAAMFMRPTQEAMVAASETKPFMTARDTRRAGMEVKLPTKAANAGNRPDQPVRA